MNHPYGLPLTPTRFQPPYVWNWRRNDGKNKQTNTATNCWNCWHVFPSWLVSSFVSRSHGNVSISINYTEDSFWSFPWMPYRYRLSEILAVLMLCFAVGLWLLSTPYMMSLVHSIPLILCVSYNLAFALYIWNIVWSLSPLQDCQFGGRVCSGKGHTCVVSCHGDTSEAEWFCIYKASDHLVGCKLPTMW